MYFKTLILTTISTILASTTESIVPFTQSGCVVSHAGPLKSHEQKLSTKCFTPTVSGKCYAYFKSYHYDSKLGRCVDSVFGGCPDGCQAFKTMKECDDACYRAFIEPEDPTSLKSFAQKGCVVEKPKNIKPVYNDLPVTCFVKPNSGNCKGGIPSYVFNPKTGSCVLSLYGGCTDSCYAFKTIEECEKTCWRATIDV